MMTDASPPPSAAPRTRGWVKILLAVSLAANLAVAGLAAGAFLRHGPPRDRDIGLGPLAQAMTRDDWKAMRPAFLERHPDLKAGPAVLRGDFAALLAALRGEPFDPAALDGALEGIASRNADRLASARAVIADHLKAMTPAARAAYADRLERVLERGRKDARD